MFPPDLFRTVGHPAAERLPVPYALPEGDDVCAEIMPDFTAASAPGHRFRCHHPVQETESTRDLIAQVVDAPASDSVRDA